MNAQQEFRPDLVRVAVAQISNLRISEQMSSWLAPLEAVQKDPHVATIVTNMLENFKVSLSNTESQRAYSYFESILKFCNRRNVNVLVFPEYSISSNWLEEIKARLETYPVDVLIAGTDIFVPGESNDVYRRCGCPESQFPDCRCYVAPVFTTRNGSVALSKLIPKLTHSPLDPEYIPFPGQNWDPDVVVSLREKETRIRVLICSDFLDRHTDTESGGVRTGMAAARLAGKPNPDLLVIPALTPEHSVSNWYLTPMRAHLFNDGCASLLANRADTHKEKKCGSSVVYATVDPERSVPGQLPLKSPIYLIPAGSEAVSIMALDLKKQNPSFDRDTPQTFMITVAPLIREETFPRYAVFYDRFKKQVLAEQTRQATAAETDALRRGILNGATGGGCFHAKLNEMCGCGINGQLWTVTKGANPNDMERLVDVVVVRDPATPNPADDLDVLDDLLTAIRRRSPDDTPLHMTTVDLQARIVDVRAHLRRFLPGREVASRPTEGTLQLYEDANTKNAEVHFFTFMLRQTFNHLKRLNVDIAPELLPLVRQLLDALFKTSADSTANGAASLAADVMTWYVTVSLSAAVRPLDVEDSAYAEKYVVALSKALDMRPGVADFTEAASKSALTPENFEWFSKLFKSWQEMVCDDATDSNITAPESIAERVHHVVSRQRALVTTPREGAPLNLERQLATFQAWSVVWLVAGNADRAFLGFLLYIFATWLCLELQQEEMEREVKGLSHEERIKRLKNCKAAEANVQDLVALLHVFFSDPDKNWNSVGKGLNLISAVLENMMDISILFKIDPALFKIDPALVNLWPGKTGLIE